MRSNALRHGQTFGSGSTAPCDIVLRKNIEAICQPHALEPLAHEYSCRYTLDRGHGEPWSGLDAVEMKTISAL